MTPYFPFRSRGLPGRAARDVTAICDDMLNQVSLVDAFLAATCFGKSCCPEGTSIPGEMGAGCSNTPSWRSMLDFVAEVTK